MNNVDYIDKYLNSDDPLLFETRAPIIEKDSREFSRFTFTKKNNGLLAFYIILAVITFLLAIMQFMVGDYVSAFVSLVIVILIPIFFNFMIKKSGKLSSDAPFLSGNVNNNKFYQDYLVNKDFHTMSVIPYTMVVEAHETAEYFFIYITKQQAFIIPKSSFIYNTPEEMRKLLRIKLGGRFIIHTK